MVMVIQVSKFEIMCKKTICKNVKKCTNMYKNVKYISKYSCKMPKNICKENFLKRKKLYETFFFFNNSYGTLILV